MHKRQIRKSIHKVLQLSTPSGVFCGVSQISGLLVYLCVGTHYAINCQVYVLRFLGVRPSCTLLLRDCVHNAATQPVTAMSTGNQTCTCTDHTAAKCSQNLVQLACFLRLAEPVRQVVTKRSACKTSSYKSCSASANSASHLAAEVESSLQCVIRSLLCVSLLGESVCLYVCHCFSLISIGVSTSMRPFL